MSVKRVFAIIGIVVGCITAFVGGVIGVMAAMGKFKTPVVKPEKIYFKNPEQVVVAQYKDDKGKDVLYSFMLVGENSSIDHEVNVKDCYIWFKDNTGVDLIELCDKNGNLLKADSKGRFKVKCNEPIYYKLKVEYKPYDYDSSTWIYDYSNLYLLENGKYVLNTSSTYNEECDYFIRTTFEDLNPTLDPSNELNGKVVLKARTADELQTTEKDLVIWVDRNVTSIFLDYGRIPTATNAKIQEQRINIGLDVSVPFGYIVNPEISWNPISKESKKIVELYYDDPKTEDYVLVNLENIKNETDYSLYQIFDKVQTEQTGELVFLSDKVTNGNPHAFKIAIFPTYEARAEYLASEKALLDNNATRLTRGMVVTDLFIEVVNSNVDKVSMSSGTVDLQLYSQNDYIYLNKPTASENDLKIMMESGGTPIDVRLNEVSLNAMKPQRFYGSPKFVLERTQVGVLNEIDFDDYNIKSYEGTTLKLENKLDSSPLIFEITSTITIGESKVINKITNAIGSYYCNNGIAFIDGAGQVKLLNVGSYLDFYIYDIARDTYTLATETDIKYSFETQGEGIDKQWKVVLEYVSPDIIDGTKTLVLGLMVANNNGKFVAENLFAKKTVRMGIDELAYVKHKSSENLDLVIANINDPEIVTFDSLFEIGGGTYTACVLVICEDELDNAVVEYINAYFEISGKKYYIVGYQNADGSFVNDVKAKDNANITSSATNNLMLLQLTNGFNTETKVQETANELITSLIKGKDLSISENQVLDSAKMQKLYIGEKVVVSQTLLINLEEINIDALIDELAAKPNELYEKSDYTLTITSSASGLIDRLCNFYDITIDNIGNFININYDESLIITSVDESRDDDKLILGLTVKDTILNNPDVVVNLTNIMLPGQTCNLLTFKILSTAPENIVYYYENNVDSYVILTEDKELAPILTAKVSWVSDDYSYEWFVNGVSVGNEFNLNTQIAKDTYSGFQDPNFKVVNNVDYSVLGNSVEIIDNKLEVVGSEDCYLEVVIAGVKRYLKIEIDVSDFALTQEEEIIVGDIGNLGAIISYKYNNGDIYDYNLVTLSKFIPQYKEDLICDDSTSNVYSFKTKGGTEIFKIEKVTSVTVNDWVFTRTNDLYAGLSVSFEVKTNTHTIPVVVRFEQSVVYQVNTVAWPDGKLYQGTTIQLYEIVKNDTDNFTTEALIKIRDKNGDSDVTVTATLDGNSLTITNDGTIIPASCGDFVISIKVGDVEIATITDYIVVPNVVVVQDATEDNSLAMGQTTESVDDFITFKKHSTQIGSDPIIFGKTEKDDKIILYSNVEKFDCEASVYESSIFESTDNKITKATDAQFVTTDWIQEIGGTEEIEVTVKYSGYEVGTFDAVLKNNYQVKTKAGILNVDDKILNIKAKTDINDWLEVSDSVSVSVPGFTITKIDWKYSTADENLTFGNNSNSIPELNVKYENVTLLLTFEGVAGGSFEGRTLTFEGKNINGVEDLTINIVPYELKTLATINAFSENSFNVLTDVYNVADIGNYEYIKVISIKDAEGNSLTNSTLGYVYNGTDTAGLGIQFNKISGDYVKAIIKYEVKYSGGLVYEYDKEITLQNWQQINVVYPENDESFEIEGLGCKDFVTGARKIIDIENYEPILININNGTTLNLLEDNKKFVSRFTAYDRKNAVAVDLEIEKLELIAYQDVLGMANYANLVSQNIKVDEGEIFFPKYSQVYGILVFRLTSTSGNHKDYYVYVTSSGTNTAISGGKSANMDYKYEISSTTVSTIANSISGGFRTTFGEYATNVKMFLLNATILADDNKEFKNVVVKGTDAEGNPIYAERYSNIKDCTLSITDYTTITLSLVYDDGYNVYPIGILTMYVRPTNAVTTDSASSSYIGAGYSSNYHNGEFAYTITNPNETSVPFPTDFAYDVDKQNGYTVDNNIVTIGATNITLNKKVTDDYKFTVFYKKGNLTIKVNYTYKAVEIPQASYVEVGKLDKGANDEETKFDNEITIDSTYFGTYQGGLKIGDVEFTVGASEVTIDGQPTGVILANKIDYKIETGVLKLIFTQGLCDEDIPLTFEFTSLEENNENRTQKYTFNVKSGVFVEALNNDNSGVNDSQRLTTTPTYDFTSNDSLIGNKVTIQKSEIDKVSGVANGVKYIVGGYTIYINNTSGKLEFNFTAENTKYVLSDNASYKQDIAADDGTINFVHLAASQNIDVSFKISNGTNFFEENATTEMSKNLYLTIAQTYVQVEAVYAVENADSTQNPTTENVAMNTSIADDPATTDKTESLGTFLFETATSVTPSAIKNKTKLRLKYIKADGSTDYLTDNFSGIGFLTYGNPNFVTFAADANGQIKGGANNTQYIQFNSGLNQNALCNVSITNNAGMPTCVYTFQVMASNKKDGITFSNEGYVDDAETYMSFTINDKDNSAYSSKEYFIGTINDSRAKGVYLLNNTGNTLHKFLSATSANADDISEEFEISTGHKYKITLKGNKIYFQYIKVNNISPIATKAEVLLYIHGSSDYILNGFKIEIFNFEITPNFEGRDTTVYGGEKINLLDKLTVPTGAGAPVLSVAWNKSKYGTTTVDTVLGESNNLIAEATEGMPTIQTKTVGQSVLVDLVLNVKIGDYFINSVTYRLQLNRSLQFFFNGEEGQTGWEPEEVYEYTTNFALTNKASVASSPSNFDLTYTFGSTANKQGNYYSDLSWKLEDYVGLGANASIMINPNKHAVSYEEYVYNAQTWDEDYSTLYLLENGKYELNTNSTYNRNITYLTKSGIYGIVEVSQTGVTFLTDYTGELNLLLTVKLTNGFNYSVNWKINVYGILTKTPTITTANGMITDNSLPFKSGTSIDLIGTTGDGVGIAISDMTSTFPSLIAYNATVSYNYAVLPYNSNDGLTNETRYEEIKDGDNSYLLEDDAITGLEYRLNMPMVPSTLPSSNDRYLVIFKVKLTYLDYSTDDYYVAYLVTNPLEMSVATKVVAGETVSAESINVDTRLVNNLGEIDATATNNKYLDLFYYSETYTTVTGSGNSATTTYYKFIYVGDGDYKVATSTDGTLFGTFADCEITSADSTQIKFTLSSVTITAYKDNSLTKKQYDVIDDNGTPAISTDDKLIISLFNVNFKNITEFGDLITRLTAGSVKIGDKKYEITHIDDGRWGVDLTNWEDKSAGAVLFENSLETDNLVLMASNNQPIYTLNHYNESTDTGFRLFASKSLTANAGAKKISDLFISTNVQGYTTIKDYKVVGVYKDGTLGTTAGLGEKWVLCGTDYATVDGAAAPVDDVTITVPKETKDAEDEDKYIHYTLQEVYYKGTGSNNALYRLREKFYVIKSDYDAAIYRANYNATVVQPFKEGEDTVVNLTGLFKKFSNDPSGKLVEDTIIPTDLEVISDVYELDASLNAGKLTVDNDNLIAARLPDDSRKNVFASYMMSFDINSDGTNDLTLYCEFTFGLYPEEN